MVVEEGTDGEGKRSAFSHESPKKKKHDQDRQMRDGGPAHDASSTTERKKRKKSFPIYFLFSANFSIPRDIAGRAGNLLSRAAFFFRHSVFSEAHKNPSTTLEWEAGRQFSEVGRLRLPVVGFIRCATSQPPPPPFPFPPLFDE